MVIGHLRRAASLGLALDCQARVREWPWRSRCRSSRSSRSAPGAEGAAAPAVRRRTSAPASLTPRASPSPRTPPSTSRFGGRTRLEPSQEGSVPVIHGHSRHPPGFRTRGVHFRGEGTHLPLLRETGGPGGLSGNPSGAFLNPGCVGGSTQKKGGKPDLFFLEPFPRRSFFRNLFLKGYKMPPPNFPLEKFLKTILVRF